MATTPGKNVLVAAAAATLVLGYYGIQVLAQYYDSCMCEDMMRVDAIVNDSGLAEECLENTIERTVTTTRRGVNLDPPTEETSLVVVGGSMSLEGATPVVVSSADGAPINIKCHRRIRRGRKLLYRARVLDQIRVKFGVPENTAANRLAIRRYAVGIMTTHGVRHKDQQQVIDFVVEGAFIPTQEMIQAAAIRRSWAARLRMAMYKGSIWGAFIIRRPSSYEA